MNRRIFLGSLFAAALVPEVLAAKRVQHQISPSKSQPAKSTPQRANQKGATAPSAQRTTPKGAPQTAQRANQKLGRQATAQRSNQKAGKQVTAQRSNQKLGKQATAGRTTQTANPPTLQYRDLTSSERTVQRPVSQPLIRTYSPALQPEQEITARPYYLSLHHTHTDEVIEIAYRVGLIYQRSALKRLNYFLRDYRTDQIAYIDPRLYDLLYQIQQRTGNPDGTFEIVSAYRSIETNEELRRASSRVARNSLHTTGQALDIRLRSTGLRTVRNAAIELGGGGVGYYPGAEFVHIDTGEVRYWGA